MDDDKFKQLKLSQQLVMTPQLQMAIRMLALATPELLKFIDDWRAERPGLLVELAPGEIDPVDAIEEQAAADDEREPWMFLADEPFEQRGADVWVFGNPPQARANARAFPRYRVEAAPDDKDRIREGLWLLRSLRQRARTYERVVAAFISLRPAAAISLEPERLEPVSAREIAEIIGMHESTIQRATGALVFQTLHGLHGFEERRGKLAMRRVDADRS